MGAGDGITSGILSNPSAVVHLGKDVRFPAASNRNMSGRLDEVSIYNRALTAAEIQDIYNAGALGKCAAPPNSAPTDISLSNSGVAENQPSGTLVGNFTATDPDSGDTHAFTFASGSGDTDNASFSISDGTNLLTGVSFNFETKNSYSIRIRATDADGLFFEKEFTITVENVIEPIVITTQPASQTLALGGSATLNVTVAGDGPEYQWRKNGSEIEDATNSSFEIADFQTSDAARYDVVVSNGLGNVTSDGAWLFVSGGETGLPSVSIVSPKNNARITNELNITISGTAKDTGLGVAQVFVSVNGVDYELTEGTTNWTVEAAAQPGLNTLSVKAKDFAGNESTVVIRNFYAVIFSELTLTSSGSGIVLGTSSTFGTPADGAILEVGRAYTVTAFPAVNNLFSNWTGAATSDIAKLTFTMESNMVLHANFVTNLFIPAAGVYNGLFSAASGVAFHSAGYASVKVTSKLSYSGKLLVDGNPVAFSGKMNVGGTGSVVTKTRYKKSDKPELTLTLALDFAGGSGTLSGTVAEESNWTANLLAHRASWTTDLVDQATAYTNSYTMLVPGFLDSSEGPTGSGYASVKVDKLGKTKAAGRTADGHILKATSVISKDGHWPFFSPQYKTSRTNLLLRKVVENEGFVMGWLQFTNNNGEGNMAPVGEVHWVNTGWTNSTYTAGFTNAVDVTGSRWLAPVPKSGDRAIGMTNLLVSFSGGELETSFGATYFVTTNTTLAKIKLPTPEVYTNSLTATLTPKTGLMKGTFVHPANSALPTKWFGAMLQDQNYGEGFFMGSTNGGKVTMEAVIEEVE